MLKRNKKIVAIIIVSMIVNSVSTGVVFGETNDTANPETSVQSSSVGSDITNGSSDKNTSEVKETDTNTESETNGNISGSNIASSSSGQNTTEASEGNINTGSETKDNVVENNEENSSTVGNSNEGTGSSDKVNNQSEQQDQLSGSTSLTGNESAENPIVLVITNNNVDSISNPQTDNSLTTSNLLVNNNAVKASDPVKLDISQGSFIITTVSGHTVVTKLEENGKPSSIVSYATDKVIITGQTEKNSIKIVGMPYITIDNASMNGISGGNITVASGTINGNVSGGDVVIGTGGTVVIQGGTIIGNVVGGTSVSGAGGTVTIIGGVIEGNVVGGNSSLGKTGGAIIIKGGKISGNVTGGNSVSGTGGSVRIQGGTIEGNVKAGYSEYIRKLHLEKIFGNVIIEGGSIQGNVEQLPSNGSVNVYKNTIKLPENIKGEVACSIDNSALTWRATASEDGYLYIYLPEESNNTPHLIKITGSNGKVYYYDAATKANNGNVANIEKINLTSQPEKETKIAQGQSGILKVSAEAPSGRPISYQWYLRSSSGDVPISGATSAEFKIPANNKVGETNYYCVVSVLGCEDVTTNDAKVITYRSPSHHHDDNVAKLSDAQREVIGNLEKLTIDTTRKNMIDKEILEYVKGNPNKQLVLKGDQYIWTINGQDIINSGESLYANITFTYEANGIIRIKVEGKNVLGKITLKLKEINGNPQTLNLYSVDKSNTNKLLSKDLKINNKEIVFNLTGDGEYILSAN